MTFENILFILPSLSTVALHREKEFVVDVVRFVLHSSDAHCALQLVATHCNTHCTTQTYCLFVVDIVRFVLHMVWLR